MQFVEGISFRDLKRSGDREAIAQAAYSIGETLAAIGAFTFPKPGWIGPRTTVQDALSESSDPIPRSVDSCLSSKNLQQRLSADLCRRTHDLMWLWAPQLALLASQSCLVHGDFGKRNILVKKDPDRWAVAAVLDWEFAISGSPLVDIGHRFSGKGETASRAAFFAGAANP